MTGRQRHTIYTLTLFFLCLCNKSFSQKITYNYIVDTSNVDTKKVMKLFENYIHSKPDSLYDNPYWNSDEKKTYKVFDLLERSEFQPSLYMGFPIHVLSIKSNKGLYEIKAQFSSCNDGTPYILCVANFYAKKEQGEYKLYNALPINRQHWQHTKFGWVDYYYPTYHKFDTFKAQQMDSFITELCRNLDLKPHPFAFYFADDFDEIQSLRGFDYWIGMGGEIKPGGKGGYNEIFYSGEGESNFHEPFHTLVGSQYRAHQWVAEGVATFFGGCRGQSLQWHIIRTNTYLKRNPDINLNNLLSLTTVDEYTDYRYVIGGLIAKKIFEKGGWSLIKEFMNSGQSNEDYYKAIEKYVGVKRNNLNKYLRQQLEIESTK